MKNVNISIEQSNIKTLSECKYGDVVIFRQKGEEDMPHVCLVMFNGIVSLTNPNHTWTGMDTNFCRMQSWKVEYVGRLNVSLS